ncbi:MAG: 2,3-bisphosphoglycerate-independent phosphoglycerate mutase [Alphaproteobacteria bacterium]|nr:2,3-bisphosphoglycerate-independent phosphoglycerate mutase [Alphaproteobacteria bacterium]
MLCILDGMGFSEDEEFNAVKKAKIPIFDKMCKTYPHTLLHAAGEHVGLPAHQMGNSEVGHTAIGLGRVIFQDLPRISKAIENDTLKDIPELQEVIATLKESGKTCHLWGLLSDGGIHSHKDHLYALVDILLKNNINVRVHACLDGRDTPPRDALKYVVEFEKKYKGTNAKLATVGGRYFGMDRDKRWDRIEAAYEAITCPTKFCKVAKKYISECYDQDISDEFVPPMAIEGYNGILKGDAFIVFNFRTDRVRQMLTALVDDNFKGFKRAYRPEFSHILGMTEYSADLNGKVGVMFKKEESVNSLGEVLSKAGLTQVRAAETEKYPHVTFFFNGGKEEPFKNEERILVGSPKVATYDMKPEMSAKKLTNIIIDNINEDNYDVYIVNFANPDMVGHTGNFKAVVKAIEVVDKCLGQISDAIAAKGGHLLVTADHGNAEEMFDSKVNQPHTAHTSNDVLFVLVSDEHKNVQLAVDRGLKDIAPTILDILKIKQPKEMTGKSIIL